MENNADDSLDLMLRYAGGDVAQAECQALAERLHASPEARRDFCDLALEAFAVAEQSNCVAADLPQPRSGGSTLRWRWVLALAALLLMGIGATSYYFATTPEGILRVADVSGSVRWIGNGGEVVNAVELDTVLPGGVFEPLSEDAALTIAFHDGSTLTLFGEFQATVSEKRQKKIHLDAGSLTASIQPQPKGFPCLLETPSALLEVLGTRFTVDSVKSSTLLTVEEGAVRVTRRVDGRVVEVLADHQVVASLSERDGLTASRRPEPATVWNSDLHSGPEDTIGTWVPPQGNVPALLQAQPKLIQPNNRSQRTIHSLAFRVRPAGWKSIMFNENSAVRVRGRLKQPSKVVFMLSTQTLDGKYGGNYFFSARPQEHESWTVSFRGEDVVPQSNWKGRAVPKEMLVKKFVIYTRRDVGLAIEHAEIFPVTPPGESP